MPKTKFMVMVCACVSVCVDPSCQSFVIHLLPRVFWMVVRQTQIPGGRRILLQGWKLISNQTNQCQNVDRLMGAVMGLMSSWPFCHTIVIYLVRPFHLIAILHYYTLLGQFVRTGMLIYLAQTNVSRYGGPMSPIVFLDWIKCVSGGRGAGEWRANWAVAWIIFSLRAYSLWSGVWHVALPILPHQADISSRQQAGSQHMHIGSEPALLLRHTHS